MKWRKSGVWFLALATILIVSPYRASAEGVIRIVQQFGTVYLPLDVIRDQKLIEKHGAALGLNIKPEWLQLSGGAAVNDALLSGNVDIAGAGIGPFLTIWDRTVGTRNEVKVVGALGAQPNFLLTNRAEIRTLKDLSPRDRIAMPVSGVSVQARILQMAAAREFGIDKAKSLDALTVTLPHPDAVAALLSGSTEISGHLSNSPFQDEELKSPRVHKVFSSYDVLGGRVTPTVLYALVRFRSENPKTYLAFYAALKEATDWIAANPAKAAETFVRVERSKYDPRDIEKSLTSPDVEFTIVPKASMKFADFLFTIGAIKHHPSAWTDYVFPELQVESGS